MSPRKTATTIALGALASLAPLAPAQQGARDASEARPCEPAVSASRARAPCERAGTVLRSEHELTFSIDPPAPPRPQCQATVSTAYLQRDTTARVETAVKVEGCAAASGEYTLIIRVKDEHGALTTLEFDETWQRSDDRDLARTSDYPLGAAVELVSARARSRRCSCTDAATPD